MNSDISILDVPGPKIALTPLENKSGLSFSGIMPPANIMTSLQSDSTNNSIILGIKKFFLVYQYFFFEGRGCPYLGS